MKNIPWMLVLSVLAFTSCAPTLRIAGKKARNPLEKAMAARASDFDSILIHPEIWEVQIIYTQIDRDEKQQPHFKQYYWNVDSNRYFYPASMVKMPLALLALEKINNLKASGYPRLSRNTPYIIDSLRPYQDRVAKDSSAPAGKPSIAQDVRAIFTVSDNLAYNHLFEFLGREYINNTLREKGYSKTGIVHRFNYPKRDNSYSSPMAFYENSGGIWKQGEKHDPNIWVNPQYGTTKGIGYLNSQDSLIKTPFDLSKKNWFALTDMDKMLKSILFPLAMPAENRFNLFPEDYAFLYRYMGIFPRECDFPRYPEKDYWDGYVKFFLFGDQKDRQSGKVRVFNKVGEAYGTLTDVAYVTDFEHGVEFMLSATILCNRDGIFNDDKYDYESVGFPFLSKLGQAILAYEKERGKPVKPDLKSWEKAVKF